MLDQLHQRNNSDNKTIEASAVTDVSRQDDIDKEMTAFIVRKRARINESNRDEFLKSANDESDRSGSTSS